jgi:hypothetical protein
MNSFAKFLKVCVCGLVLSLIVVPLHSVVLSQRGQEPQEDGPANFQITLEELGYGRQSLGSPYSTTAFAFRLPADWEIVPESFFVLEFSYLYTSYVPTNTQSLPAFFGELIVRLDGETQHIHVLKTADIQHAQLEVSLPPTLTAQDVGQRYHVLEVILDASHICQLPHNAELVVHPTSYLFLSYMQAPLVVDLANYPYPFYQRSFFPDSVHFVLPSMPSLRELQGASGVAAKLGDLTYNMAISSTTDSEFISSQPRGPSVEFPEHLIVIGSPEDNELISILDELEALPVSLHERQLHLSSTGPISVTSGDMLTYTLVVSNTLSRTLFDLKLVDDLPRYTGAITCTSACSIALETREVHWNIPTLPAQAAHRYTLTLYLDEAITQPMVINSAALFDRDGFPLNVNTLTTTVQTAPLVRRAMQTRVSPDIGRFFVWQGQAVPETAGVVLELISPWDAGHVILVLTGLDDAAVLRACRALSSEYHFLGMRGQVALVEMEQAFSRARSTPVRVEQTFADLGYGDRIIEGESQSLNYYFDMPEKWLLTEQAGLELHFNHSPLIMADFSRLDVLLNGDQMATLALDSTTAQNTVYSVSLSPYSVRPGRSNRLSFVSKLHPLDKCDYRGLWLRIFSTSRLHLEHRRGEDLPLNLDLYPYPLGSPPDLSEVLLVLPSEPVVAELTMLLRVSSALGAGVDGKVLMPALLFDTELEKERLADFHIVLIGRPSRNALLRELNQDLPQPFLSDSDEIGQKFDNVIFYLPPRSDLGVIQLFTSPWNDTRAVLAITGMTDEGIIAIIDVMVNRYWDLRGNITVIFEGKIRTLDTRGLTKEAQVMAVTDVVSEIAPVFTATLKPTLSPTASTMPTISDFLLEEVSSEPERPTWLMPLVAGMGGAVVIILVIAFWQARRRDAG